MSEYILNLHYFVSTQMRYLYCVGVYADSAIDLQTQLFESVQSDLDHGVLSDGGGVYSAKV